MIEHYDEHPRYWSPLANHALADLAATAGVTPAGPLLDVGCGDGRLAGHVAFAVTGVDVSEVRIGLARAVYPGSKWHCADLYAWLRGQEPKYRTIVAVEVLEHLESPRLALDLMLARLAEDGAILGTVPLDMPYLAHLQVFPTLDDVRTALTPDFAVQIGGNAVCRWN